MPDDQTIDATVIVKRRWNDPHSAKAPLSALREVVTKNDPGGVCSPISKTLPLRRIWCDQLVDGSAIHLCDPATASHELQLCAIETDNSASTNAQLRAMLRR
jgi:hypothetical protein